MEKKNCVLRLLSSSLVVLALALCTGNAYAETTDTLTSTEETTLETAISFMDKGMVDTGIDMLIDLDKIHHSNRYVIYEIVYGYIIKQDYTNAYQWAKKLVKLKDRDADSYFMAGNAYDYSGHRAEAVKLYEEGLKKFPQSGRLWVEKGNIAYMDKDYDEAVRCYEESVERDPQYGAAYYRLANLFSQSDDPVWAVMYAQMCEFKERKPGRVAQMGQLIYALYRDNVRRNEKGEVKVSFTKHVSLSPYASCDAEVPFNYFFENIHLILSPGVLSADTLSLQDVATLHRKYVEMADTMAHDYYDVPILDLERAALHAGHLDGYIIWMLWGADEQNAARVFDNDDCRNKADAFVNWYTDEYSPTGKHERGVARPHTTVASAVPVPREKDLLDAKACKAHKAEIRAVAKWMLDAVPDSLSLLQRKMTKAMTLWLIGTDDMSLSMDGDAQLMRLPTLTYFFAAAIDYATSRGIKEMSADDYVAVMMTVAAYAKRHKGALALGEELTKFVMQDDEALRAAFRAEYAKMHSQKKNSK